MSIFLPKGAGFCPSPSLVSPAGLAFVTSTPLSVAGGSGTYVGISGLARALETRNVRIEMHAPAWLPPGLPGYDETRGSEWAFDKDEAQQVLTDAGFPNGEGLPEVTLTVAESQANRLSSEFLQQQIEQNLGFGIKIEVLESATYEDHYLASDFQVVLGGWGADYADPENFLPQLFGTGASTNQYKYSNNDFDDLMDQAATELDNDKRIGLYQDAEAILIDEDLGVAPLFNRVRNCLLKPYVDGFTTTGLDGNVPGDFFYNRVKILEH